MCLHINPISSGCADSASDVTFWVLSPIHRFSLESHFKYIVYDLPGPTCQIQTSLQMLSITNHNI